MSGAGLVFVIVAVVAVLAVVAWMLLVRKHPEEASTHTDEHAATGTARFHDGVDRPAGPGAEADGVAGPGEPTPGPGAEQRGGEI